MSIGFNFPVVVINWKQSHCKCLTFSFAILLLTLLLIGYWIILSDGGTKHALQNSLLFKELYENNAAESKTGNSDSINKHKSSKEKFAEQNTSLLTSKKEEFYFDGPLEEASVTLDNSWAAFFYYRLNTNAKDWKCKKLHRLESHKGNFDYIFFCEDMPPELDCIMYSFGINYVWDNEELFRDRYNCNVFTFDPSMTDMANGYIKPRINFMRVGLANIDTYIPDPLHKDIGAAIGAYGRNKAWTMHRFSTLLKMLNHTNKLIDLVAIDAEGAEFGFLEDIVETGAWKNIKQLCIEYHFFPNYNRFFIRHAKALSNFRRLGNFLQLTHELVQKSSWDQNGGDEFNGKHASYLTAFYINKLYINKSVSSR
jgi:hypothetical protein